MVLARAKGYICWTSDSLLKRQCEEEGIKTRWGLEMMITLCQRGRLSEEEAIEVAQTIRKKDSSYITQEIVDEFERKLKIALLPGH